MRKASIPVRLLAFSIDCVLLSCLGVVILAAAVAGHAVSEGPSGLTQTLRLMVVVFLSSILLFLFYFTYLTAGEGKTVGKRIVGLKAVKRDGSPLGFGLAFLRCLMYIISIAFWPVSLLTALFCDGRTVHDIMTGTRVIKEEP
jgi:uncharacterized RDD family membrane protein YckC